MVLEIKTVILELLDSSKLSNKEMWTNLCIVNRFLPLMAGQLTID
jgi:hypothetical protein